MCLNLFIASLLILTWNDGFRGNTELQRRFSSLTDPVLSWLGIRQGRWSLFAPNIGNYNCKLVVHVAYADGTVVDVPQFDSQAVGFFESFIRFPEAEYWMWVRQSKVKRALPFLCRCTLLHVPEQSPNNAKPVKVTVEKRWAEMHRPPPQSSAKKIPPGPLKHLSHSSIIYTYKVKA